MDSLLEQLRDIEGLDTISFWPLALGFWVLMGVALLFTALLCYFLLVKRRFKHSWKMDALQKLNALEENLSQENSKATVIALSEYLRRIALKRFCRKECAGLMGKEWLSWLSQRDEKGFDWQNKGQMLIKAPYAKDEVSLPLKQIKELIQATKRWIR